jgi:hypothetical protein
MLWNLIARTQAGNRRGKSSLNHYRSEIATESEWHLRIEGD